MKQIVISAVDDGSVEAGHIVVRLNGIAALNRYRLKPVGPAVAKEPHWPAGLKTPIAVRSHDTGIDVIIGPDVAEHVALLPGTAVLLEAPDADVCGEFLWPAVAPARRAKRKRLAQRIGASEIVPQPVTERIETTSPPTQAAPIAMAATARVVVPEAADAQASAAVPSSAELRDVPDDPPPLPVSERIAPIASPVIEVAAASHPRPQTVVIDTSQAPLVEPISPAVPPPKPPRDALFELFEAPLIARSERERPAALRPIEVPSVTPVVAPPVTAPNAPRRVTQAGKTADFAAASRPRSAPVFRRSSLAAGVLGIVSTGGVYLLWPEPAVPATAQVETFPSISATTDGPTFRDARRLPPKAEPAAESPALPPAITITAKPPTPAVGLSAPPATIAPPPAEAPPPTTIEIASIATPRDQRKLTMPSCGAPEIRTRPLAGGMMALHLTDTCHRGEDAVLAYGSFSTLVRLDAEGVLEQTIDCIFGPRTHLDIRFPDGMKLAVPPMCGDMDRIAKVAVIWRAPVNLDLHAFEKPTVPGMRGQVSAGAPRTAETARRLADTEKGPRGFLSSRADQRTQGARIEAYTVFLGANAQSIPLGLDYESRALTTSADLCGTGEHAEPVIEIVRLSPNGQLTQEQARVAGLPCESKPPPSERFQQSRLAPLRANALPAPR